MKKSLAMILALCVLFLTALPVYAEDVPKLNVVTTIFPPYDFVRQIAGDAVELTILLPPGTESHSFEPRPQDILRIQNADVFIYVGGQTDVWVDRILNSMDVSNIALLPMLSMVDAVEEEIVEGMEHSDDHDEEDHDDDHDEIELDEHVWTSPENAKLIVNVIVETLSALDSRNADTYRANADAYIDELDALDAAFQAVVDRSARTTVLFGDRFPFRYMANAYGLTYYAAFPGCATETEASAATIATLIDKVRAEKIPVVFSIEFSNGKIADVICESTGAVRLEMHSCHNLSKTDFDTGLGYLELMYRNVEALKEALW